MKKLLFIVIAILTATTTFAQSGLAVGQIRDASNSEGIIGVVVEVAKINGSQPIYITSGLNGEIRLNDLGYGEYKATARFVGYDDKEFTFKLNAPKITIPVVEITPTNTEIDLVVKQVQALRTSQRGDTISYSADAYKVANDSDVEGILKKMPGITVTDGQVEAQGESVNRILVDGKEFFGDDVATAIKSLPSEAVEKIEVFDKLSDAAEFSGMDDGEGFKAINIVTKNKMHNGTFGQLYAGYGYDFEGDGDEGGSKYVAGGNVNYFNNDTRLSVLALFNNINQQNFSFEDIVGATGTSNGRKSGNQFMTSQQKGIATVNAIGLNYSDVWGKQDKLKVEASYFFNDTDTENNTTTEKIYETPRRDTLLTNGYSLTRNANHRFNSKLEWKISDNHNIMIRPNFSYQDNSPLSRTDGLQFGESGYDVVDSKSNTERDGYNANLTAMYRAKLGKAGRTLTLVGSGRYNSNHAEQLTSANQAQMGDYDPELATSDYTEYPYPTPELLYQQITTPIDKYTIASNLTYTEPLSANAQLSFQYRYNYDNESNNKRAYTSLIGFDDIDTNGTPNPNLSSTLESGYTTHNIGPGFRYVKDKSRLIMNIYYQNSVLDGSITRSDADVIRKQYDNLTYFIMGQLYFNPRNSLKMFVRSYTDSPSITNLQTAYDVTRPQNIFQGNPNLNPEYINMAHMRYINTNIEKGSTFMWMGMFKFASDYISSNVQYGQEITVDDKIYRPYQFTSPVNMDGYWYARTDLNYGFPIPFMKCNLNLMGGVSYSNVPSMIDSETNIEGVFGVNTGAVLGSNISENVDFTLAWHSTYNEVSNSIIEESAKNRYFYQTASANMRYTLFKGITLTLNANYTQNLGFTDQYNDSFVFCNAYIGKKLFKSQRGEISFGVNDMFDQNKSFVRTTGSGWTQNMTNSVIGRYYMVKFVFNLRSFGGKSAPSGGGRPPHGGGGYHPMM